MSTKAIKIQCIDLDVKEMISILTMKRFETILFVDPAKRLL